MSTAGRPELAELQIADPAERWEQLAFGVEHAQMSLGGIRIDLGAPGNGIVSWSIRNIRPTASIDGLSTTTASPPPQPRTHPNGATGIDHVVIVTPDFDRTANALAEARMSLSRIRDAGTFRQGFRRLGPAILELVEAVGEESSDPARFWGLVVIVEDLNALKDRLGDQLGDPMRAVQPGRRIATLRESAGLTPRVAFMDPPR